MAKVFSNGEGLLNQYIAIEFKAKEIKRFKKLHAKAKSENIKQEIEFNIFRFLFLPNDKVVIATISWDENESYYKADDLRGCLKEFDHNQFEFVSDNRIKLGEYELLGFLWHDYDQFIDVLSKP